MRMPDGQSEGCLRPSVATCGSRTSEMVQARPISVPFTHWNIGGSRRGRAYIGHVRWRTEYAMPVVSHRGAQRCPTTRAQTRNPS